MGSDTGLLLLVVSPPSPEPRENHRGSGLPSISLPEGSITKVRVNGSLDSRPSSQLFNAFWPPDSKARAAWAYSVPRCTQTLSCRCCAAEFTATVIVPTRISASANQKVKKIRQYSECMGVTEPGEGVRIARLLA